MKEGLWHQLFYMKENNINTKGEKNCKIQQPRYAIKQEADEIGRENNEHALMKERMVYINLIMYNDA